MGLISEAEEQEIVAAIKAAELSTSGEIRVHIDEKCMDDAYTKAIQIFEKLGMTATKQKNGVLIYISIKDRKLAIIGDSGINEKVPENFWESTKNLMLNHFKNAQIAKGIIAGITEAGKQLKTFFPRTDGDQNELTDQISY